jgi:hypothetical protein
MALKKLKASAIHLIEHQLAAPHRVLIAVAAHRRPGAQSPQPAMNNSSSFRAIPSRSFSPLKLIPGRLHHPTRLAQIRHVHQLLPHLIISSNTQVLQPLEPLPLSPIIVLFFFFYFFFSFCMVFSFCCADLLLFS